MKIDEHGQIQISETEAIQALYSGRISHLGQVFLDDIQVVERYNSSIDLNADSLPRLNLYQPLEGNKKEFDRKLQNQWLMPESYLKLDIEHWLLEQCNLPEQILRVQTEIELYNQFQLIPLLKYLKYLVDTLRSNNIVWGVGRGSSVASYCLYLIGVHKIDSLRWNLDIREFLKSGE